jgi:ATP/maltotriose-dependent transcriptional regulator MalT
LSPLQAVDHFLGGFVRLLHGEVVAAHTEFVQAHSLDDQLGAHSQLSLDGSLCLLRTAALLNDFDVAYQHAERIATMLQESTLAAFRQAWGVYYLSQRGWLCWLVGRYEEARAIADELEVLVNDDEWPLMKLIRRVLRCLILVADRDFAAAEPRLRAAYVDQQQFRDSVLFADAGLLLAYVYLQWDRPADALAILDDVLAAHEHGGTPGLVLLTGAPIVMPLLRLAITHNVHGHFAARILRALPEVEACAQEGIPANSAPPVLADHDQLTRREMDILRLLAKGRSNQAIADELIVSVGTVKRHVNSILGKLQAASRLEAVAHARQRGLV